MAYITSLHYDYLTTNQSGSHATLSVPLSPSAITTNTITTINLDHHRETPITTVNRSTTTGTTDTFIIDVAEGIISAVNVPLGSTSPSARCYHMGMAATCAGLNVEINK
jgi:hypothetical protein